MIYNDFQGEKLSKFVMGCMRLPVFDGDDARINEEAARQMVAYAFEHGVNYFDTAYGYHGANSERIMGKILSEYPRESFKLATKFPGYMLNVFGQTDKIFNEQLEKCGVGYFDYYMLHNVCEQNIDYYMNEEKYGTQEYLLEQKRLGRIKHLGFSTHGNLTTMRRFLEAYGKNMEFCQIQLNYLDYTLQDAKAKLELLAEYDIPVWVMEPVRGGMLAKATPEEEAIMRSFRPDEAPVAWALRWLMTLPQVKVILCGSSTLEQMAENIAVFEQDKPLSAEEVAALEKIAADRLEGNIQPCTKCRYCAPHCPLGIDIPWMMELCNEYQFSGSGFIVPMAIAALEDGKRPADCIGCGSCAAVCPQQIDIPQALADLAAGVGKPLAG